MEDDVLLTGGGKDEQTGMTDRIWTAGAIWWLLLLAQNILDSVEETLVLGLMGAAAADDVLDSVASVMLLPVMAVFTCCICCFSSILTWETGKKFSEK